MIGRSPIRNKSELTFYQKPELYKKLEVNVHLLRNLIPELKAFREPPAFKISTLTSTTSKPDPLIKKKQATM